MRDFRFSVICVTLAVLPMAGCGGGNGGGTSVVADFSGKVDAADWVASDGYANGGAFNAGWSADNAYVAGGALVLQVDDECPDATACSGKPYKAGEFGSTASYGYGRVSARLQAAKGSGLVTSLFTYSDDASHDEIDVEILGQDTTQVQFNYFVNGVGGHEQIVDLGFDAAAARHTYAFEWWEGGIAWYVDGVLKHQVTGGDLPSHPGRIVVNLWPATGVDSWTGPFTYAGAPIKARYDYIRYDGP